MAQQTAIQREARSRTQQTYLLLRDALLACRYPPGSKLRILELCSTFDVSQGAVREALSRLISEGLVEFEDQRGFRVKGVSIAELRSLSIARSEIEGLCLANSIPRGDIDWEARVVAAFHKLFTTPPTEPGSEGYYSHAFLEAYKELLQALVAACDNPWLLELRNTLMVQAMRYSSVGKPVQSQLTRKYKKIMKLVLARDTAGVVREVKKNMLDTVDLMVLELERSNMQPSM